MRVPKLTRTHGAVASQSAQWELFPEKHLEEGNYNSLKPFNYTCHWVMHEMSHSDYYDLTGDPRCDPRVWTQNVQMGFHSISASLSITCDFKPGVFCTQCSILRQVKDSTLGNTASYIASGYDLNYYMQLQYYDIMWYYDII